MCICGIAGGTATDDARVKCAHKGKALLYADFGQGWGNDSIFSGDYLGDYSGDYSP